MLKGACANTSVCRPEFDCVVIASGRQNDLGNSAEFNNALAITTLLLLKIMVRKVTLSIYSTFQDRASTGFLNLY